MRKVLKFVKGKLDEKKEHGSSIRSLGVLGELPSPADQGTPTEENYPGFVQGFGYNIDLSGKDKSITKLHKAAWLGNLDKVKVNLKKTDVDAVDRLSRSSLHLAAAQGHASVVWFLLNNGANMNIYDSEGKTPFLKAIECGHKEAINLMLERGVDINTVDFNGNTGLHIAAKQGFYEIATMLLKQGANFECANSYGEFPLHIATVAEYKDLVELLLRYGSSVNIVDRDNRSPLMFAAKAGNMPLVQLFLEYGAQRAVMDSNDWTAEDYALMAGHQDVAAELKSPSERVAMPFTEQAAATKLPSHKRSVSIASLPVNHADYTKKEKTMEIQAEEGDNSDTWNDSQMSDSSSKPKGKVMKLSKFLPPSDDEISEESIQSPRVKEVKEDEMQDSPRSCVIPPPCKPPRSWDLIQSGVIDDPKTLEPRRRSLLPLGSLRSRRESFNESPNGADSPSLNSDNAGSLRKVEDKARQHIPLITSDENEASSSTKYEEIAHVKEEGAKQHKEEDVKSSSSDSDWDSDNSLPMDNYLPPISPTNDKGNQSFSLSTEKRNRFLMRAPSIDLTDDDGEAGKDKRLRSPNAPGVEPQDKALSVSGTLGREGTLLGYEEMWEANAHLSAPTSAIEDIKEETENAKDDGDILLFHSPRIEHKVKGYETSARSVDEVGKGERYKLESRSLDTLEPAAKVLHSKRHTRQQSMSIHTWSQSEELHDKPLPPPPPPMTAELDHMIEENKRINAQLRCYDEALRELAHVSVRKQGSLSLPRTQEASCLIRSQSAGARSEGLFSLPSASEMAQSAIVRKQGSLSLPRTSEIPDFAMMQSLGSKKHSSASEFAMREMAQTAIVKRQGSLSLPKTCEMPDLTVASGEEYLSLPRSNQLIDEAFKEIGNSTATMKKRGSRSLPRTIDAKAISLGADPTPPSRHKKLRNRRRAESESEAFNRKLEDADVPSKSLSFEKSLKVTETEETDASTVKLSPKEPGSKTQVADSQVDKPIRKKRKMLLAMRGFVAPALKHMNGSNVSQISTEESVEEQPFWMSTDREGGLARQSTVIERPVNIPVIEKESSPVPDIAEESIGLQEEAARDSGEQSSQASSQKKETDVQSDDAESGLSQSDNTPQHLYALKSHHLLLKQHLQRATSEKSHLEEIAAMLGEETQKLKYELAEAREAARSRDEVIAVLESQVARMETLYTTSLEESQKYKLRLGNLEQELQHVKDVCAKLEEEKVHLNEIIDLKDMEKSTKDEQTRLQAMMEEKELEKKQQVLQVHLSYLEAEKTKQAEIIAKLEEKNVELEARLDKVTAINQSLAEEKTLLNEKNVTDCKLIEEKSEKWKEMYESCMEKLEDVSVSLAEIKQEEAHATKVASEEKEKLKQDLRDIIEKIEDARLKGSEDWHNKLHEEITSAIHLLGVEYSRLETSLVKHSKKLEILMDRLLTFIQSSEQRPSAEEKCIIHEAVTLVEQLKHLNLEHQQQLQEQQAELKRTVNDTWFEHNRELNEENKQLKKDLADFQNKSMQGTRELLEQLKCENTALREQIEQLVEQVRESKEDEKEEITREIWNKLQQENNKLEEQLELLQEKLAICDCKQQAENEVLLGNMQDKLRKITEENDKLMKENKNLQQVVDGMNPCGDCITRTAQTMTDPDMEIMHLTMENASLHSQLQQLSEDFAEKELELQMAKLMRRQDEMDALVCENCSLKKELEEVQLQAQLLHKLKTENSQLKAHLRRFLSKDQEKEGHARFATWLAMDNEMYNGKSSVESTNTDQGTIIISLADLAKPSLQRMTSKSKSDVECINLYGPPSNFESLESQSGLVMDLGAKTLEHINGESAQYQPPVEGSPEQQNGESAAKNGRVSRDAATNTASLAQTFELQRELQLEKERCKKYQQNVKKLKSDIQILKNKLGENRKAGKQDSNLVVKQNNTNAMLSPSRDEGSLSHFQKQIAELEQKVREENSLRFSLEVQINKMRYELQEKLQLEQELGVLRNRLERDFVSRYELEQLKNSYEMALSRAKYEAEMEARDDLNEKLCHINSFIEKQVQEQMRNTTEVQMKQDFQDTQLKLLSELAKVQATLQTKGEQEKELREKCEKLTRECEKKQEIKRKKLIEKSYSVNLAPSCANREKEISTKFLDMRASSLGQAPKSPISSPPVATVTAEQWPSDHPFSHILRRELERSIRKHTRTDSLSEQSSSSVGQSKSDEQLQVLKKKYFLH